MYFTTSSLAAVGVTLFAAAASASGSPSSPHAFAKRQAGSVDITTGATGGVQPRLEIGNLATRPDEWSLYIQAMSKWQQAGEEDTDGYYGVASVHGVPYEDANGVSRCDTCSEAMGFGTHDMVIFPTWHRIYLSHFEQKFLEIVQTVAQSYPASSRDRMLAAANVLRLPYWDWASKPESNSTTFPKFITDSQITIQGPNGQETIDNPLYKFSFTQNEAQGNYYSVFTTWLETYRYPNANDNSAKSDQSAATAALSAQSNSLRDQVYQLLTACDDWMHFSNDQAGATAKCANSIESIHNNVHTLAGGPGQNGVSGGHMTYLPLSTYDPAFWLHHANVDRIIAMWQTIHADKWGASQKAPHSTWTIASGAQLNMDYPLKPFNKDSSSYWTSNDVKDWTALGYTYPEFSTSDGSKSSITKFVNSLYGNSPSLTAGSVSAQIASPAVNQTESDSSNAGRNTNSTSPSVRPGSYNMTGPGLSSLLPTNLLPTSSSAASGAVPTSYKPSGGLFGLIGSIVDNVDDLLDSFLDSTGAAYEYACNIQTPRYALNGSYYIFVFNGAPASENPSSWVTDENLAGMMGVLANPEGMAGNDLIVTGSIPLTRSLRSKVTVGSLISMAFDTILPFLTKNVEWRIVKDGQEVDVESVEGFSASIYSSLSKKSTSAGDLPSYSDYTPQLEVTKGKKGGAAKAIFGTVDENKSGDSTSTPSYGGSSGSESSDEGSSPSGASPSYGSSGSASPHETAPAYVSSEVESGTAAPSGPATASAYGSVNYHPVEGTCVAVTTTVQETETVYVTASSTPEAATETHPVAIPTASVPVEETQPAAYSSASASVPVEETHPVATSPAETHPAAPYPIPSASSSEANAVYPTASGAPTAPVYQPSGTGGKVYPTSPATYTGAASAQTAGAFVAGLGAFAAFFL